MSSLHLYPNSRPRGSARLWSRYMRVYDRLCESVEYQKMQKRVGDVLEAPARGMGVDIGCGTGNSTLHLTGPDRHTHGVDSLYEALIRAQPKFNMPDQGRIDFHCMDSLGFLSMLGEGSVDRVVAVNTLYTMENAKSALEEIFRVLEPGGRLVFVDLLPGFKPGRVLKANLAWRWEANSVGKALYWIAYDLAKSIELLAINSLINREAKRGIFHLRPSDEYLQILTEIGFISKAPEIIYANQAALYVADKPAEIK